jgi:hypothetical protein
MDEMTTNELATSDESARAAREGVAMMRAAEGQWAVGALKTAEALHRERMRLKNDAEFGAWCKANGLGEDVISKNERVALIKVGSNMPYWQARIAAAKGRSIRMIVENDRPPGVSRHRETSSAHREISSTAAAPVLTTTATDKTPIAPKAMPTDRVHEAADRAEVPALKAEIAALKAKAAPLHSDAPFEIENLVLGYEARIGRFPTAPEIAEALETDEATAAKGLTAMVKARKAGGASPIRFSEAQKKHVDAFEEALKRRYYKITETEQRKLARAQREAFIDIEARAEARTAVLRKFATDKLAEWAGAHAVFTKSEYLTLLKAIMPRTSDEANDPEKNVAAALLNERAFLATGGKMGSIDAIERAKRTRAEAMAERAAKAKATREAAKAAKVKD